MMHEQERPELVALSDVQLAVLVLRDLDRDEVLVFGQHATDAQIVLPHRFCGFPGALTVSGFWFGSAVCSAAMSPFGGFARRTSVGSGTASAFAARPLIVGSSSLRST